MDLLGYARIDILNKNPDMITLMHQAGFTATYFGVESGDQSILKAMDKNFNLKESLPVVMEKLKEHGIDVWASFIFGFPGETKCALGAPILSAAAERSIEGRLLL